MDALFEHQAGMDVPQIVKGKLWLTFLLAVLVALAVPVVAMAQAGGGVTKPDLTPLIMALAAGGGGTFAAFLGWLDSGEKFEARKFAKSVMVSIASGVTVGAAWPGNTGFSVAGVLATFAAGAGIDLLVNRASGAMAKAQTTSAPTPKP